MRQLSIDIPSSPVTLDYDWLTKSYPAPTVRLTMCQVCLHSLSRSSLSPKSGPSELSLVHKGHVAFPSSHYDANRNKLYHHHQKKSLSRRWQQATYEEKQVGKEGAGKKTVEGLLLPINYPTLSVPPVTTQRLPTLPIKIQTTKKEAAWQDV